MIARVLQYGVIISSLMGNLYASEAKQNHTSNLPLIAVVVAEQAPRQGCWQRVVNNIKGAVNYIHTHKEQILLCLSMVGVVFIDEIERTTVRTSDYQSRHAKPSLNCKFIVPKVLVNRD